jgi:hypothetical protein
MKATLIVNDLPASVEHDVPKYALTSERMKRLFGGRSVVVTVDGNGTGTVNDFDINTAIFEGRIKGSYL